MSLIPPLSLSNKRPLVLIRIMDYVPGLCPFPNFAKLFLFPLKQIH